MLSRNIIKIFQLYSLHLKNGHNSNKIGKKINIFFLNQKNTLLYKVNERLLYNSLY